jgi:hypothetical protein
MLLHRHIAISVTAAIAVACASGSHLAGEDKEEREKQSPVEYVKEKPQRGNGLGTKAYEPSERETPFFKKLAKDEIATGGFAGDYDITKKDQKYVGWFGIIREIQEDKAHGQTVLLLEHKYFDGLTDLHILALSFNGSGDFRAVVPGVGHPLRRLALVKVYGTAAAEAGSSLPTVKADFVRHWDWGTFTFLMASGTQRGSEKWRKINTVDLDDIYDPYPGDAYYEKRLGKR